MGIDIIGGDGHDRWGQTNTKLSWTQMFCAQRFFGPGNFFEPKIYLNPNFFYFKFFGLNIFWNQNLFGLLIFLEQNIFHPIFWVKIFFDQNFRVKNFFGLSRMFGPKYLTCPFLWQQGCIGLVGSAQHF